MLFSCKLLDKFVKSLYIVLEKNCIMQTKWGEAKCVKRKWLIQSKKRPIVPETDETVNIIYEDKTVNHKDGTVTTERAPKLKEVEYTEEQMKQFFALSYEFLSERYGKENVISVYVHLDETTPHMHFLFIPIVDDKKWNEKHPEGKPRVRYVRRN